jgi:hypothetical protein
MTKSEIARSRHHHRARKISRRIIVSTPPQKKGGAERRGLPGPHGPVSKNKRHESFHHEPRSVRALRAQCWRPYSHALRACPKCALLSPGGVTKPSFWERPFYPPLAEPSPDAPYLGYERARPGVPVARGQRAGHSRLQPLRGLRNLKATAPAPHAEHACRTCPSVERDKKNIILLRRCVKPRTSPQTKRPGEPGLS